MTSTKIYNYYLVGKDNYNAGLNSTSKNIGDKLLYDLFKFNPPIFNFRNTIHEVGFIVKNKYENFKYYKENETLVVFDPFHFKDLDGEEFSLWSYSELLFHQGHLFGVSFKTINISIYEKLQRYLIQIYGDYKEVPSQDSSTNTIAWFSKTSINSIFLEIDHLSNGSELLALTFFDGFLQMSLDKPVNVYRLIRNQLYELENEEKPKSFLQKAKKIFSQSNKQNELSFKEVKFFVEELLSEENSISKLKTASDYILKNVKVQNINLQWGDWLMDVAVLVQDRELFKEAEGIYNLVIELYNSTNSVQSKEKLILVSCAYKNLINLCCDSKRYDEAISNFNHCVGILKKHFSVTDYNFHFILGQSYYNVARVYYDMKDYMLSIEHNKKALKHFEYLVNPWMSNYDKETILLSFNNLGNAYTANGNYVDAESTYETGIRFAFEHENYYQYGMLAMNLAYMWAKNKNFGKAEVQYKQVLEFVQGITHLFNESDLKGQILINMANLYQEIKDQEKERKYLSDAIAFYTYALDKQPQMKDLIDDLRYRINELIKNKN